VTGSPSPLLNIMWISRRSATGATGSALPYPGPPDAAAPGLRSKSSSDVRRQLGRVLIVDNDADMRCVVAGYLEKHGMMVTPVADGDAMWAALKHQAIDLLILEIDLPEVDGLCLCRTLRLSSQIPIMLTARADRVDAIVGFELGADAYVTKPYHMREILARVTGILRRMQGMVRAPYPQGVHAYRFCAWTLDGMSRTLWGPNTGPVLLSDSEHRILAAMLANPGVVLPRDVLRKVAQRPDSRSTDVCVSRLRSVLGDDARSPKIIKTVYGEGYSVAVEVEELTL
jgi:two-component system, OmpR family, response regulator